MPFQLKDIVPWGRSFPEYVNVFALTVALRPRPLTALRAAPPARILTSASHSGSLQLCCVRPDQPSSIESRVRNVRANQ